MVFYFLCTFSLVLMGCVSTQYELELRNECNPHIYPPISSNKTLDPQLALPSEYKTLVVFTDWIKKVTTHITEVSKGDSKGITVNARDDPMLHFIYTNGNTLLHNGTSGACSVYSGPSPIYLPDRIKEVLGGKIESIQDLVNAVLKYNKEQQGFVAGSRVVAGVEGVQWISCVNITNTTNTVQIEVIFADTGSIHPASKSFDNPSTLSLRFAEYKDVSDKSPVEHISYEIDLLDTVTTEDADYHFSTPAGTVCSGLPTVALDVNLPDHFETIVHFAGFPNPVNAKLLYTPSIVAVSSPQVEGILPIFNEKIVSNQTTHVVHDFQHGLEYHLSENCVGVFPLSNDTSDVKVQDGSFSLRSPLDLFIPTGLNFSQPTPKSSDDGPLLVYHAKMAPNKTIEVVALNKTLYAVKQYTENGSNMTMFSSLHFYPVSQSLFKKDLSWIESAIHTCFVPQPNATITMDIKDKTVSSVFTSGLSVVSRSIEAKINSLTPISSYRIHTMFVPSSSGSLSVIVALAEPTVVLPSPVKTKVDESSVDTVLSLLNSTVASGDWKISVTTAKGVIEDWIVLGGSLAHFPASPPPAPQPHFEGYTGGSMFVLAVFMLLLGVGVGTGGLYFATRRQRISTLAYQVFE